MNNEAMYNNLIDEAIRSKYAILTEQETIKQLEQAARDQCGVPAAQFRADLKHWFELSSKP